MNSPRRDPTPPDDDTRVLWPSDATEQSSIPQIMGFPLLTSDTKASSQATEQSTIKGDPRYEVIVQKLDRADLADPV